MDSAASPSLEAVSSSAVTERTSEDDYPNKGYKSDWFKNTPILREEFLKKLHIGDLLEFERGHYRHWAVYIGNGLKYENEVVHLCNLGSTSRWFSGGSKFTEGQNNTGNPVQAGDLFDVWADSTCRINNSYDEKSHPLPWNEIFDRAIHFSIGSEKEFERYKMNCEHFAHFVRNHHSESQPLKDFLRGVYENGLSFALVAIPMILFLAAPTFGRGMLGQIAVIATVALFQLGYDMTTRRIRN